MHPVLSKLLKTKAVHADNCELSQGHLPILPTEFCQLHPLANEPIARCVALPAHSGALVFLHKLARLQKAGDKILGNGLALLLSHDQAHPGSESSFVHGRAFPD